MTGMAVERDQQGPDRERMLDVVGLAARLGVTERFVRRLVHERRIPFYKVGSLVRFDVVGVIQPRVGAPVISYVPGIDITWD